MESSLQSNAVLDGWPTESIFKLGNLHLDLRQCRMPRAGGTMGMAIYMGAIPETVSFSDQATDCAGADPGGLRR
jgi:hypothetical protein